MEGKLLATRLFRMMNFELFMQKNYFVMGVGVVTMAGVVGYFAYDNHKVKVEQEKIKQAYRRKLNEGIWSDPGSGAQQDELG